MGRPEYNIVKRIIAALEKRRIFCWKQHGSEYQLAGLPDVIGVLPPSGKLFGIEVKRPGEEPTKIQHHRLKQIKDSGGISGWATSVDEALDILDLN